MRTCPAFQSGFVGLAASLVAVVLTAGCGSENDASRLSSGSQRLPTLNIGRSAPEAAEPTAATTLPPVAPWTPRGEEQAYPNSVFALGEIADPQFVVALDKYTGTIRWKRPRQGQHAYSTPLLIQVDGQDQIVSAGGGGVCAYHPRTGEELWWCRHTGHSVVPRPVFSHGLVFICTGYYSPSVFAIDPTGREDVTGSHIVWESQRGTPFVPSPLIVGDQMYLVSDQGVATCLDVETGMIHWQHRLGGRFAASPWLAEGRIHFLNDEGTTFVIEPGLKYKELAQNRLDETICATPAVSGASLFFRTQEHLYRIEQADRAQAAANEPAAYEWPQFRGSDGQGHSIAVGQPLIWSQNQSVVWKVPVAGKGWSSPVVSGDQVWLTTSLDEGRSLRAFCFDRGSGTLRHDVEVFQKTTPGPVHLRNTHASPTPVVDRDAVYVHFGAHGTACLSRDGDVLWRARLAYHHHHGPASSPIVVDDLLIFNCDGFEEPYDEELMHAAGPDYTGAPGEEFGTPDGSKK